MQAFDGEILPMLIYTNVSVKTRLKATITRCDLSPNSFVLVLRYCVNLKAIRYETTSLNPGPSYCFQRGKFEICRHYTPVFRTMRLVYKNVLVHCETQ